MLVAFDGVLCRCLRNLALDFLLGGFMFMVRYILLLVFSAFQFNIRILLQFMTLRITVFFMKLADD